MSYFRITDPNYIYQKIADGYPIWKVKNSEGIEDKSRLIDRFDEQNIERSIQKMQSLINSIAQNSRIFIQLSKNLAEFGKGGSEAYQHLFLIYHKEVTSGFDQKTPINSEFSPFSLLQANFNLQMQIMQMEWKHEQKLKEEKPSQTDFLLKVGLAWAEKRGYLPAGLSGMAAAPVEPIRVGKQAEVMVEGVKSKPITMQEVIGPGTKGAKTGHYHPRAGRRVNGTQKPPLTYENSENNAEMAEKPYNLEQSRVELLENAVHELLQIEKDFPEMLNGFVEFAKDPTNFQYVMIKNALIESHNKKVQNG